MLQEAVLPYNENSFSSGTNSMTARSKPKKPVSYGIGWIYPYGTVLFEFTIIRRYILNFLIVGRLNFWFFEFTHIWFLIFQIYFH